MASKKGPKRVIEIENSKLNWQSTPSVSRNQLPARNTFEDKMPFKHPPSPVLQEQPIHQEAKHDIVRKPSTLEMISKAIEELGAGRKGSSVPAIKKWIMGNYPESASSSLNLRIRKALLKGLESGSIDRSTKSAQLTGAKGFFIVPKQKPAAKKPKKETKDSNAKTSLKMAGPKKRKPRRTHASDSEVTIIKADKRKSAKLHVSDSEVPSDATILKMRSKKTKVEKPKEKLTKKTSGPAKQKAEKQKAEEKPKIEKTKVTKTNSDSAAKSSGKSKKDEEKQSAKKVEKPSKKAPAKPKKGAQEEESNKVESSAVNKRSARNK